MQAIKYINKYIYKGDNCTTVQLLDNNNKISKYLYGRYIGPTKAIQQLFKFPVYKKYPSVIHLTIHLPGQQPIYFQLDKFIKDLQQCLEIAHSTLTAWFQYNTENINNCITLYQDFPYRHTFMAKTQQWQCCTCLKDTVIGYIYYCSPVAGERYYLQLLLTVVPGATSFEHLHTVASTICPIF